MNSLVEHLNAEIALEYITNVTIAVEWLESTYLFARMKSNPEAYHLSVRDMEPERLTDILTEMISRNLKQLQAQGLILLTNRDYDIEPTPLGKIMANFCLSLDTMNSFLQVPKAASMNDIFNTLISLRDVLQDLHLRTNEKKVLRQISEKNRKTPIDFLFCSCSQFMLKTDLRWPLQDHRIVNTSQKLSVIIQVFLI